MQSDSYNQMAELVEENVLIRRRKMRRLHRIGTLRNQAESQAKKIVMQASESAEKIKAAAWQEGYCQGLQLATGSLVSFMGDYHQWSQRAERRLHQQLSQHLQQLFSHASVLPDLLEAFNSALDRDVQRITLILPENWCKTVLSIKARLAEITPCTLDHQYHAHNFCILKAGDQLIDFDCEIINEVLSVQLINKKLNRAQCYTLSDKHLQNIKFEINQYIDNFLTTPNEKEESNDKREYV